MEVMGTLCICFLALFSVVVGSVLFGGNAASEGFYNFWNRAENALRPVYELKVHRIMHLVCADNSAYLKWRLKVTDSAYQPP